MLSCFACIVKHGCKYCLFVLIFFGFACCLWVYFFVVKAASVSFFFAGGGETRDTTLRHRLGYRHLMKATRHYLLVRDQSHMPILAVWVL